MTSLLGVAESLQAQRGPGWAKWLILLGFVLWIIAYALIIRKCFRDKTYGVPWPSICFNLSWELYFGFTCPAAGPVSPCQGSKGIILWLIRAWFVLDLVILGQFLAWGRKEQIGALKRYFWIIVPVGLVLTVLLTPRFVNRNFDDEGLQLSWIYNAIMSILFIELFFVRPQRQGLSYGAAWAKMLGSAAMLPALPMLIPLHEILYLLAAVTVAADLSYIALFHFTPKKEEAPDFLRARGALA